MSLSSLSSHNPKGVSFLVVSLKTFSSPQVFIMAVFLSHATLEENSIYVSPVLCVLCCFSLSLDKGTKFKCTQIIKLELTHAFPE